MGDDGGSKMKKPKKPKKPKKVVVREKMDPDDTVRSDSFTWKVIRLLGSGGFGDVYKVIKEGNADKDKKEYAMKTEMVEGDKRMLRLKIEVMVLMKCHDAKKDHFVQFVDRGKTRKFKFLVMGLVGPSLDDIRRQILKKNYSRSTALQASIQTLESIRDLHQIGYLHRDIKPQNFAVGLEEKEKVIYMLDFGIARKFTTGTNGECKKARANVKFLGTLRFASRACHKCVDQGRKDDLETWVYMAYDLIDAEYGIAWKGLVDRDAVLGVKEQFFKGKAGPKIYRLVPCEMRKLLDYLDEIAFETTPDYAMMISVMTNAAKANDIDLDKKLDWIGLKREEKKKEKKSSSEESSSDMKQSGASGEDSEEENNTSKRKSVHQPPKTKKSTTSVMNVFKRKK